jgi:hypothetical protein
MMGHWNSFHKDEHGDLSARECRIQNLRNTTGMSISMTEQMTVEIARNMAAVTDGEGSSLSFFHDPLSLSLLPVSHCYLSARFPVSADATADELALLWEVSSVIYVSLHCFIHFTFSLYSLRYPSTYSARSRYPLHQF